MPFRTDNPLYPDILVEGQLFDSFPHDIITLSNSAAAVKQVDTIAPGTAANSTAYTVDVDGTSISYTSDADATAAEIQAGLLAALKASPLIYRKVIPTAGGSNTVVLTARTAGTSGRFTTTLSGGGTGYALTNTTAAADPAVIPFGRAVTTASGEPATSCKLIAAALSSTNILRGIACRTNVIESVGIGYNIVEGYPAMEAVNVVRKGQVAVRVREAVTPLSSVYVYHTGTYAGQFRATADDDATQISSGVAWARSASAGGLAVLDINFPA